VIFINLLLLGNDILQLDWLSNIVDNSCHENLTVKKVEQQPSSSVNKEDFVLLERSSSPTHGKTTMRRTHTPSVHVLQPFSPLCSTMQLISPISSLVGENMQNSIISNMRCLPDSQIAANKWKIYSGESKKKKKKVATYCCCSRRP